ncbi:MAG: hypothetical protein IK095_03500 [Oscillospiraceae bacterium]|nr:hypothetical protein [Oscillospiraceae bacterium]
MSFVDELRKNTKTKAKLAEEKISAKEAAFQWAVERTLDTIKDCCLKAGQRAERSVDVPIEPFHFYDNGDFELETRADAERLANEVELELLTEGLDVRYKIMLRTGKFGHPRYVDKIVFHIRW